jgi:hypothetical protein
VLDSPRHHGQLACLDQYVSVAEIEPELALDDDEGFIRCDTNVRSLRGALCAVMPM